MEPFHCETGDLCGVSQSTVCKIVNKVCSAIYELKKDYIKFSNAADQVTYKVEFYEYGNLAVLMDVIFPLSVPPQ